ncbi:MAG: anhydro-N-acetylmuramic acid kinase [Betaproteobacteria bacterium]|jgi:anhydro-N-acetylmuramic acid kinase
MSSASLYIGLMSGTSLDGVDAVLADFTDATPRVIAHAHHGFASELHAALLALNTPGDNEIDRAAIASQHLGRCYAAVVHDLLLHAGIGADTVRAVGVHGQTVRHRPEAGYTVQLNAPALVAELIGIDVVADFRSRDMATGGQGAPLVSALHAALFTTDQPRVIVNIGGISNLTILPARGSAGEVLGFDCGPGNVLLDAWTRRHLDQPFDRDGAWAAQGEVDHALLAALLAEPFFAQAPPKSTGRDLFNLRWLEQHLHGHATTPVDVAATLVKLTARTIAHAAIGRAPEADVLVCGGGARNASLMRSLAGELARPVLSTQVLGIEPVHVEALAFAWLARAHVEHAAGNVPSVTGARGARVLGALYPA